MKGTLLLWQCLGIKERKKRRPWWKLASSNSTNRQRSNKNQCKVRKIAIQSLNGWEELILVSICLGSRKGLVLPTLERWRLKVALIWIFQKPNEIIKRVKPNTVALRHQTIISCKQIRYSCKRQRIYLIFRAKWKSKHTHIQAFSKAKPRTNWIKAKIWANPPEYWLNWANLMFNQVNRGLSRKVIHQPGP